MNVPTIILLLLVPRSDVGGDVISAVLSTLTTTEFNQQLAVQVDADQPGRLDVNAVSRAAQAPNFAARLVWQVCLEEGMVLWRQAGRETKMIASNGHSVGCEEPTAESGVVPPVDKADGPHVEKPKPSDRTGVGIAGPKVRAREVPAGAARQSLQSSLAEQNDLFAAAMGAERQGNLALAIARLETLLARFPDGPLAESAKAEVARLRHSKMPSATDF